MRTYQAFWFAPEEERFKISAPSSSSVSRTNGHVNGNGNTSIQDDGLSPAWIALFASLLCVSLERMGAYDAKASWSSFLRPLHHPDRACVYEYFVLGLRWA